MADQPSYRPLTQSDFFGDARSARPLEAGTVAHGLAPVDGTRWAGRKVNPRTAGDGVSFNPGMFVTDVPLSVTPELLERGQERYTIYCSVCHDRLGTGDGKIVQRGFTRPPSLLDDDSRGFKLRGLPRVPLREAPLGYFYEVISNGFGAMPDYAAQIPAHDRWAIVAYVRVLQISQRPTPEQTKKAASRARKSDPEKQP
jgi:mono/diheme cytochrome c family protein